MWWWSYARLTHWDLDPRETPAKQGRAVGPSVLFSVVWLKTFNSKQDRLRRVGGLARKPHATCVSLSFFLERGAEPPQRGLLPAADAAQLVPQLSNNCNGTFKESSKKGCRQHRQGRQYGLPKRPRQNQRPIRECDSATTSSE